MTEKEAREALLLKVQYTVISHDLAPVNEAIDALLAARTEAIAQMLRTRGLELIDLADGNETVNKVLRVQGAAFLSAANEARRDWGDTE